MKQYLKNLILFGIAILVCFNGISGTAYAAAYAVSSVDMQFQQVSEHVYFVQGKAGVASDNEGFISNATAIITDDGIVVVDALGTPSLAALFLKKLEAISNKPVVMLIATHYHADHIYGLQVFKERGAKIIAPYGYQDYLDSPAAAERLEERQFTLDPWVNEHTYLVLPDEVINANTSFAVGGVKLNINYLGKAHSDGDMSVLVIPDKVLISGDLIFEGRVPFTGSADTGHWLALLESLNNSDLKAIVPGHGPLGKDPNATISLTARYLESVRDVMQKAVDDFVGFDEAFGAADWSEFSDLPAFSAAHRLNAYGIFLSIERESLNQ